MGTPHVYFADVMLQYDDDALLQRRNQNAKESSLSPSSISPTPRYERNMGFFQQLSRRFGLRSNDDLVNAAEDDTHSSSTDSNSCSSAAGAMQPSSATSMSSPSCTSRTSSNSNSNSHAASVIAKDVHDSSLEHISCASSDTSSIDEHQQQQQQQQQAQQSPPSNVNTAAKERKSATRSSFSRLHRRSTSSIRRAFESFSLSSRSLSCSGATPPLQRSKDANAASSNGNTPIKSALKSTSNVELHKKSAVGTSSSSLASSSSSSSSKCTKSKTKPPPQRILRQPVSYTYLKGISGLPTQRVPRSSVCCQYARR